MTTTYSGATTSATVLGVLADGRWHTCCEIADETGMLPVAVRATLKQLAEQHVVSRRLTGAWLLVAPSDYSASRRPIGGSGR